MSAKTILRSIKIIFVLFTLWIGLTGSLEALLQCGVHMIFVLPLIFLSFLIFSENSCGFTPNRKR